MKRKQESFQHHAVNGERFQNWCFCFVFVFSPKSVLNGVAEEAFPVQNKLLDNQQRKPFFGQEMVLEAASICWKAFFSLTC